MTSNSFSNMPIEDLLHRAREGDREAWAAIISRHKEFLGTLAAQRVPLRAPGGIRPSDVAQEAALKALQSFRDLSLLKATSQGELEGLLRRVVESSFLDMVRKAETEKRDDSSTLPLNASEAENVPARQPSPSQASAQGESWRELLMHFSELPDDQRDALSLLHFQQLPMKEIATRLNRSEDALESLLRRGMRTLRDRMEGSPGEPEPGAAVFHTRMDAALSVYFRPGETAAPFELEAFLANYPDCADELRSLLGWLEKLGNLKPPIEK